MTNKEAIIYLEWLSNIDFGKKYPTYPMVTKPEQAEALRMAITALENAKNDNLTPESAQNVQKQALKMQKSDVLGVTTGETCSDTISRQAAIDAADKIIERDTSGNNDVVKAMTAWKMYVEALPSVQPLVIHCTDCEDWLERQSILGFTISQLPSAQPETCDTCKHGYFGDEQCNDCRVRFTSHYERGTDEPD